MKMKITLLSLLLVMCYDYAKSDITSIHKYYRQCKKEMNLSNSDILSALNKGDKHTIGCLQACLFKYLEIMKNGHFDLEVLERVLRETNEKIVQIALDCAEEISGGKDECTLPEEFQECVIDNLLGESVL